VLSGKESPQERLTLDLSGYDIGVSALDLKLMR
jgi:hypothetical protein